MSVINWLDEQEAEELHEALATVETGKEDRFQITDLSSLNWTLRKLKVLEKSHNEDLALLNEEIARLREWFNKQSQGYDSTKEFLEGLIAEYAKGQQVEDAKWKGQKTPHGRIGFRKQQPKWDYGDEEALANLLFANGMEKFVKTVRTPIKTELKEVLGVIDGQAIYKETGEVVAGITVTEREPLVVIKLED